MAKAINDKHEELNLDLFSANDRNLVEILEIDSSDTTFHCQNNKLTSLPDLKPYTELKYVLCDLKNF